MIERHKKQLVAAADLGDERLNKRFGRCFESFAHHMEESIPSAMQDVHQAKSVYRFYENERVSYQKLLQAEREASLSGPANQRRLFIQDTTDLDFTGTRSADNLGCLSYIKQKGMYLHNHLVASTQGVPIGLFAQHYYARTADSLGNKQQRKYDPIEEKESYRWLEQWQELQDFMADQADSEAIMVADREADIHEVLQSRKRANCHYLIRSRYNRKLDGQDVHLWDVLGESAQRGQYRLELTDEETGKTRSCQVAVRYGCYTVQAPHRTKKQGKCEPVTLYALEAKEVNPKGEPICWRLLSSLPIHNLADAKMLLRYYSYRWRIERLHYILKSGAKIEELQLATGEQLQKAVTLLSIVSAQLLQLMHYARVHPELSISQLGIAQPEWQALQACQSKGNTGKTGSDPPSVGQWIRWLTALVGFKASKRQPFPGVKRLWMALRKWHHIYQGFLLAQNKPIYG
jgi:hypothetical protein